MKYRILSKHEGTDEYRRRGIKDRIMILALYAELGEFAIKDKTTVGSPPYGSDIECGNVADDYHFMYEV